MGTFWRGSIKTNVKNSRFFLKILERGRLQQLVRKYVEDMDKFNLYG